MSSSDSDEVRSHSRSPLKTYLVVEEIGSELSIICRQWLIPNTKSYWHPGALSDKLHLDLLRAQVPPRHHSPFLLDGGELKVDLNWRQVKYLTIHYTDDNLRRVKEIHRTLSDCEGNADETEKKKKNSKRNSKSGHSDVVTEISSSSPKKKKDDLNGLQHSSSSGGMNSKTLKEGLKNSWPGASKKNAKSSNKTLDKRKNSLQPKCTDQGADGVEVVTSADKNYLESYDETSLPFNESEHQDNLLALPSKESEHQDNRLEAVLSILSRLENKIDSHSSTFTRMETNQAILIAKSQATERRLDRLVRNRSSTSTNDDIKMIISLLPISTKAGLLSLDEKLMEDDSFRDKFSRYLDQIKNLNVNNPKKDQAIYVILETIFDMSKLTEFGNWSGTRIVKNEEGTSREKVVSFRSSEVFKMVLAEAVDLVKNVVEAHKIVQEWIRNCRGTKLRYHSGDSDYTRPKQIRRRVPKRSNEGVPNIEKVGVPNIEKDYSHTPIKCTHQDESSRPLTRSQTKSQNTSSEIITRVIPFADM